MSKARRPRSANLWIALLLHIGVMPMINVNPSGKRMHPGHPGGVIFAHDSLSKWHMMVMNTMLLSDGGGPIMDYFRLVWVVIVIIMGGVDHVLIISTGIIHGFSWSISMAASCYSTVACTRATELFFCTWALQDWKRRATTDIPGNSIDAHLIV